MDIATAPPADTQQPSCADASVASASVAALELRQLQRSLLDAVSASSSNEHLLSALGGLAAESLCPVAIRYFRRDEQQRFTLAWQFLGREHGAGQAAAARQFLALSDQACKKGFLQIDSCDALGGSLVVAVPVFLRNRPPEALAVAIPASTDSLERVIVILQLVASHITIWHTLQEFNAADADAQSTAGLLEILAHAQTHEDMRQAGYAIAARLQEFLKCQRVAVGLTQTSAKRCRLIALSDHAKFDRNSSLIRSVEAALDEALLRDTHAGWPAKNDADRHATRALQKLCKEMGSPSAISAPLAAETGEPIGAWLFLYDDELAERRDRADFIRASNAPVASCLQVIERAERGSVGRLSRGLYASRKSWRLKASLIAAGLVAAALWAPAQYKVKCDCQLQPFTRRFIAAPFEGQLEKAYVGPGDMVRQGDLLARMDGRDIRWELAGVEADRGQAAKRRDAGLATRDMVTAQLARLELDKLEQQTKVLEHRFGNLEIKSPIDGIIVSGDQERAEGAPLTIGQGLFEVAPLDQMVVQLEVPEDEIPHVRKGMEVVIQLDALPGRPLAGTIARVHPRSEIKDDANVFVAEVHVHNNNGELRPGMDGRVKILSDRHTLAWNLFHKPWNYVAACLGW